MFLRHKPKSTKLVKYIYFIYKDIDYIVKVCPKYKATLLLLELFIDKVIKLEEENNNA
jgi:hypothetical protein